ncbi:MAG: hypothetical protein ACPG4X_16840 [Pikeienuella sp.]
MDLNAAPDGPVTEEVVSEVPAEAPAEMTEDQELDAVYDRVNEESAPEDEAPEQPEDEAPVEEQVEEEPAPEIEVPTGLPEGLRNEWSKIPETARNEIIADRDGLHRHLSEMGRQVKSIAPIRDTLVQAIESHPHLADMKPDQVAGELLELAGHSARFVSDPIGTMMGLVKQHGLEQAMSQALSGQDVTQEAQHSADLHNEIKSLKQQLQRAVDPNYLRDQVTQITSQERTVSDVQKFADSAEHWADVENHIPLFIPVVQQKLGESAAHGAVLEAAYNMAIETFKPDAKASPKVAADEAAPEPDPEKAAQALKAKSVNVSGKPTGKPRPMTEDEQLDAAYERAHRA